MDLSTILAKRADFAPDQLAVVFEQHAFSYEALCTRVAQTAGALTELGVEDRKSVV